jgi:hypothetical protein
LQDAPFSGAPFSEVSLFQKPVFFQKRGVFERGCFRKCVVFEKSLGTISGQKENWAVSGRFEDEILG